MIIFDVVLWLIVAKIAVMLFDDASAAVRGKRSPRMKERAARRAAEAVSGSTSSSGWARTRAAVGGYAAALVEDAAVAARAGRRRRRARRRGRTAVDGVLVELDDDGGFSADCDVCGWTSRRFQVQDNARAAGAEHATGHQSTEDEKEDTDDEPTEPIPAKPWKPRVIPGGAADPTPAPGVVHHDDHTYCLASGCPTCRPPLYGWRCDLCGTDRSGFATTEEALADATAHPCPPADPADSTTAGGTTASTDTLREQIVNMEATGPEEIRNAFATAIEISDEKHEEVESLGVVLTDAADRFESIKMSPSTVELLREAAEAYDTAQSALAEASEHLQSALTDFDTRDGAVADAVAEAGGNVASEEVLVG